MARINRMFSVCSSANSSLTQVRTLKRVLPFLLLIAILLPGCGGNSGGAPSAKKTFYYNESEDLNTLDPARINARPPWWIGGQIYIGLVGLDSGMRPVPQLARSWSVSDDGRTWRFTLRDDVHFGNDPCFPGGKGRRVTARDVAYSFERICTPQTASTGFWVFRGKVKGAEEFYEKFKETPPDSSAHVAGIRAVNDTTFDLELVEPFAPMLPLLSIPYCYVIPQEAVTKYGKEFANHPVGAGPFRLAEWTTGSKIVLERNPNYYERDPEGKPLPYLDSVVVSFIKDKKSEFAEYEAGRLDAVSSVDPTLLDKVFKTDGKVLSDAFAKHTLHQVASMSIEYYGFMLDTTTPGGKGSVLATNRYLRQAFNYAIDREALVRYVLRGQGIAASHGPIPPGTPGYSGVGGYGFDRARAQNLLDSAGYPGGKGLPDIAVQISEGTKNLAVAQVIQEQLKSIGVTLTLSQVAPPQHREQVATGKLPFWRANWMADYPDGENFLVLFYSKFAAPSGSNTTHFANQRVDSIYNAALDPRLSIDQRAALYGRAERIILDEAPWIFLFHSTIQRLTQPGVQGYTIDPLDRLTLTYVRKQ